MRNYKMMLGLGIGLFSLFIIVAFFSFSGGNKNQSASTKNNNKENTTLQDNASVREPIGTIATAPPTTSQAVAPKQPTETTINITDKKDRKKQGVKQKPSLPPCNPNVIVTHCNNNICESATTCNITQEVVDTNFDFTIVRSPK